MTRYVVISKTPSSSRRVTAAVSLGGAETLARMEVEANGGEVGIYRLVATAKAEASLITAFEVEDGDADV